MTRTVILIHGLGLCQHMWRDFVPEIESWGYDVLTYDLPGHGAAAPLDQTHTLQAYADQLLSLMDVNGVAQAHLVGFSLGGMINRKVALCAPNRVVSLAIWNSPHDRGEEQQLAVEGRAKASRDQGPEATLEAALERWFTDSVDEEWREQIRVWRRACDPTSYADAAWVLANGVRELIGPQQPRGLPTQVMTCSDDVGSTPAMARDIARDLRASSPLIVPDLKHLGLLEKPDLFLTPLKQFLVDSEFAKQT